MGIPDNPLRTAIYVRVSTEEQKIHGLSIEAQTEALDEWAKAHGVKVVGHYNDAGISARKKHTKRPELLRLLEDVKAGRVDLIVFTKLDRWFRNIAEYYKVQEILEANNVNWKTIHEDYDTSTASGRLKINIMLSVAQDEADRTSERIKAVFDAKKKNGEPVTGNVPTGYRLDGKTITYDHEWKDAVDTFFSTYLASGSPAQARKEALRRSGKVISYQLATLMLKNRAYSGRFHGIQGMCPQYITEAQYARIQQMRKSNPKAAPTGRTYLFSGLVFCAECGHRLSGACRDVVRKDGTVYSSKYYLCQHHYVRSGCKNGACTRERYIEDELIKLIPDEINRTIIGAKNASSTARQNRVDVGKLKRRLARLQELYLGELIDLDAYRKEYGAIQASIQSAEAVKDADSRVSGFQMLIGVDWAELYASMEEDERGELWRALLQKVSIDHNKQITIELNEDMKGVLSHVK